MTIKGGTLRVPPGQAGLLVAADNVTLDGLSIIGSQAARYDEREMGIAVSAQAGKPVSGLTIRDCTISDFGGVGAYLLNVADVVIDHNRIFDVVYAGIMVLSGDGGVIRSNDVERIGVLGSDANEGNAYGITLTRLVGPLALSPRTTDFVVLSNIVADVPTWHALDTHAGQAIVFDKNTVRQSSRAIFVTTDGQNLRPSEITVSGNTLYAPTGQTSNLQAITTYAGDNVVITGNTAIGWTAADFFEDYEAASTELVVTDNVITP